MIDNVKWKFDGDQILVWIPYNKRHLMYQVEGRKWWDPDSKCWRLKNSVSTINSLDEVLDLGILKISKEMKRQQIKRQVPDITKPDQLTADIFRSTGQVKEVSDAELKAIVQAYKSAIDPRDYQIKAVDFIVNNKKCALFWEMGLGKTKATIDFLVIAKYKARIIRGALIVLPKSVIPSWQDEFKNHGVSDFIVLDGSKRQRLNKMDLDKFNIINYEGLLVLKNEINKFNRPDIAVVLDESSKIKSPKAKRTKLIVNMFDHCEYKICLSGTPVSQNVIDIYPQYKFLDPGYLGFKSWYTFRNNYCVMGGYQNYEIIGYKNLPELKKKISDHGYILKKKDCLDLPDKIYQRREIELSDELKKQYKSMHKDLILEISEDKHITAPIILVKILRLHQIMSGCFLQSQKGNTKLNELMDIVTGEAGSQKIIIWTKFRESIAMIKSALDQAGIGAVTFFGDTEDREATINKFKDDPNCRVFIGQIQTGGMGINLQCASLVIYFENTFSLQDRLQSEDRCHRIGQKNNVTYIDIVCKGTIDEDIISAIKDKREIADFLIAGLKKRGGK